MDTTGIGIIGCGRISDLHAAGYLSSSLAKIVAVCDSDPGLAAARAESWGADAWYTDYRELLMDPAVDAVDIITPQRTHETIAIAAMVAGKHVSLQKPMTVDLQSADRIVAAAKSARESSGLIFRLFENYLFYPPLRKAKNLIDEGAIGDPTTMRIKFISGSSGGWEVPGTSWAWRAEEHRQGFGRQTFDHGHHMWSVARYFMGDIEKVTAWIDSVDGDIDCPATIMWKYKSGPRYGICDYSHASELHIPSTYYACDEWFEITGSRGIIQVMRCTGDINSGPPVRLFRNDQWTEFSDIDADWGSSFRGSTDNFIAAIHGTETASLSAEEGREVLKMDIAIQESAKRCKEIRMDEFGGHT